MKMIQKSIIVSIGPLPPPDTSPGRNEGTSPQNNGKVLLINGKTFSPGQLVPLSGTPANKTRVIQPV